MIYSHCYRYFLELAKQLRAVRGLRYTFIAICFVIIIGIGLGMSKGGDYQIFLKAGSRMFSGELIYQANDGIFPFKYHPIVSTLFGLWAKLPPITGKLIFLALSAMCFLCSTVFWCKQILSEYLIRNRMIERSTVKLAVLSTFCLAMMLKFLVRELEFGQVNAFLFATVSAAYYCLKQEKHTWAGILIGTVSLFKLNYLLLLVPGIWWSRKFLLGGLIPWLCAQSAILISFADAGTITNQWLSILFSVSEGQYIDLENQGIMHFISLIAPDNSRYFFWLISVSLYCFIALGLYLCSIPLSSQFAFWLFGVNYLSPLAWWNQYILAVPMLLIVFLRLKTILEFLLFFPVFFVAIIFQYELLGPLTYNLMQENLAFTLFISMLPLTFLKQMMNREIRFN